MTKQETLEKNGFDFEKFKADNEYSARNILKAMEEYGKYCAEQAWAFVGVKTFNEWWAEFQRKEETK
jgi:hypothetical protein